MAYCTSTDLINAIPKAILQQLSDDQDTDEVDLDKINYAIARAQDLIDGYMRGRYEVPLTVVPDLIRDIAVKLSIYYLFKRSLALTLPDPIKEDYDYCMKSLGDMQKGRLSPFPVADNPTWIMSNKRAGIDYPMTQTITRNWTAVPT